ncbi:MAG: O-antigen ligase family protein [Oligoflexia bacterium]|nr:O-antigen ligase family protein [Oligoflexia bacterium]MBF0367089.1 O-antigen ligase family protein [Oligoflexia bacterium]
MSEKTILNFIRTVVYAMIVAVPLVFALNTMFPFIIVKSALFQSLAEIIIGLWGVLAITHREYRPQRTPLAMALFGFLAVLTFASLFGKDFFSSLWSMPARGLGLVSLWHFGLLFLALASLGKQIDFRKVFTVSVATSIVASASALLTYKDSYLFINFFKVEDSRPGGVFGNPTFLAGYLLFNIFIALWTLVKEEQWRAAKVISLTGIILGVAALFNTQTRGDMIALVMGLAVVLASWSWRRNSFVFVLVAILLSAGAFVVTVSKNAHFWGSIPGVVRLTSFDLSGSFATRLLVWRSAWQAFLDRPLLGWGWENYNLGFQHYYGPMLLKNSFQDTVFDKPHNLYLEYVVTGGALTLLAYLALMGVLLYYVLLRSNDNRYKAIMLGLWVAYFVRSLVIFDTIGTYLMFFLVAAWMDTRYRQQRGELPQQHGNHSSARMMPWIALALVAIPIYFVNWRMVYASYLEHSAANYYLLKRPQESLALFQEALEQNSIYRDYTMENFASVVKQSYAEGMMYPELQNLVPYLVREMEEVQKRHRDYYFYYLFLAEFKNQFHQFNRSYLQEASALAEKAVALSPNRQQIYYVMAKTKLLAGDRDAAYALLQKTIALNPAAGDPHFYFGILAYERGDAEVGRKEIARAKELGRVPNSPEEAEALGSLAGDIAHNYAEAIAYYQLALAMKPADTLANMIKLRLAIAYYFNGVKGSARDLFNEITASGTNLKALAIFPLIRPMLDEIGIVY